MKPYYQHGDITIYHGDALAVLSELELSAINVDCVIADPPYGETTLDWDVPVTNWLSGVEKLLAQHGSVWCFGKLKTFIKNALGFLGWHIAQDIVWEKHNGSNFQDDRFKNVHEQAIQLYPQHRKWTEIYKLPVYTFDATARRVKRAASPQHTGAIAEHFYESEEGGPRLMRSVIYVRSCHGYAVHPTQKPVGIITPLIDYSCIPGGLILDPFMGSGSSLVAARDSGRKAIGIEISEEFCERAVRRLSQGSLLPLAQ